MPVKYEALIGYIFKGLAVADIPAGVLVEATPRRAHRSREQDTLFVMISPAGHQIARPEFYTALARLAADNFFASRLGVTGALREAAVTINQRIQDQNSQQAADHRAGAIFMVKRADDIYMMRAGTTLCVAQLNDGFNVFPADPDMLNMLPLGARSEPMVEFTHFELTPNDLFVLGNGGIAGLDDDILQSALKTGDVEATLDQLEQSTDHQAMAMIIQFVDAETTTTPAVEEIESSPPSADTAETPVIEEKPVPAPTTEYEPITLAEDDIVTPQVTEAPTRRQSMPRAMVLGCLMLGIGVLRSIVEGFSAILDRLVPEPENGERQQTVPMNLVALLAVGIPVVIGVIAVGFAISRRDTTRFDELKLEAEAALNDARNLEALADDSAVDPIERRNAWLDVLVWAERAYDESPDDEEIRDIIFLAQTKIDEYDRISRLPATRLRSFADNADLRGPILSPNMDLFTLDRNRGVYRDQLDSVGQNIVESEENPIIAPARPVNNYIVSPLVDIEWMDSGGVLRQNVLVALDEGGLLVSYHGSFDLSALQLQLPPQWNRPEAIAVWGGNFYVLDAGANQIWRFRPEGNVYNAMPEEYFEGNNRPDLTTAVDLVIDDDGLVYILYANGTISRFESGQPRGFEFLASSVPANGINNGQALFFSSDPLSYSLFLADQSNDAIYQISLGGTVNTGFRPSDLRSNAFDQLSGVYADVRQGNLYILAGKSLYRMPLDKNSDDIDFRN